MMFTLILLSVLSSLLTTLEQKTLKADITATMQMAESQAMTYSGDFQMRGNCFQVNMMSMEAAYDGKTMYLYSEDTEELTLSTPSAEELAQVNPLLFAKALVPVCEVTETAIKDGAVTLITLVPKANAEIERFTLKVATATLVPISVDVKENGGKVTSVVLKNATYTTEQPNFTLQKEGAFINDLRQ